MGWQIGFDAKRNRDIGYGVPAYCDHPDCNETIDRGLAYVCGGEHFETENGCGLYFCSLHRSWTGDNKCKCERCLEEKPSFPLKPEHPDWMRFKLSDSSWEKWRKENPEEVKAYQEALKK